MKCDELKPYVCGGWCCEKEAYPKDKVDEAIAELKKKLMPCLNGDCILTCEVVEKYGKENAELKARIADLENLNHDLCERVTENDDIRLHWEEVEQTRAANECLKAKLEDVQASHYAEMVDAGMRERKLKRELWLARAEMARTSAWVFWNRKDDYNYNKWKKVEFKCRVKAEEYK